VPDSVTLSSAIISHKRHKRVRFPFPSYAPTGPVTITAFSVLYGAGNGLLTIAKGTVPLAIFGPVGYALRSGILGAPGARAGGRIG
jgi:hypothetical protein